jgi:CRP-like cAMP-binding protein
VDAKFIPLLGVYRLPRPEQGSAWSATTSFEKFRLAGRGRRFVLVVKRRLLEATRTPPGNRLLAALPPDVLARIAPAIDVIPLELKRFLYKPGEPIHEVYFPGEGFCSVVSVLADGRMVEVATIGREGMVGVSAVMNGDPSPSATMVQAEMDICYRMPVSAFRSEMARRGRFQDLLIRYAHALVGFIMQSTACNAVHTVEQRLARWLLMAHDRVGKDDFPLTQEFAAMMLGTSRPTVTLVAGTLQKAGLITYRRGHLTIVDRERLESASCECYRTTTDLLEKVTRT